MKIKFLILFAISFSFLSCEEIAPVITMNMDPIDPVEDQQKNVLVEEYTGVRCVQCPGGAAIIKALKQQYGKRLVPVAIHAGDFANPFPQSNYVFISNDNNAFMGFVGSPLFYPAASIDRFLFDGQNGLIQGSGDWAGSIAQRLDEELKVEVSLSNSYDSASNTAEVSVSLNALSSLDYQDLILNVLLVENDIVDPQLTEDGMNLEYVHEHVLRGFFTPTTGDPVDALTIGSSLTRDYSLVLADDMNPDNIEIVAFLSRSGAEKEVFQANYKALVE